MRYIKRSIRALRLYFLDYRIGIKSKVTTGGF